MAVTYHNYIIEEYYKIISPDGYEVLIYVDLKNNSLYAKIANESISDLDKKKKIYKSVFSTIHSISLFYNVKLSTGQILH